MSTGPILGLTPTDLPPEFTSYPKGEYLVIWGEAVYLIYDPYPCVNYPGVMSDKWRVLRDSSTGEWLNHGPCTLVTGSFNAIPIPLPALTPEDVS